MHVRRVNTFLSYICCPLKVISTYANASDLNDGELRVTQIKTNEFK